MIGVMRPASGVSVARRLNRTGLLFAGALALFIPLLTNPSFSFKLALGGSFAVTVLSLVLLTGFLGQISLVQAELMAVGAYTAAHLSGSQGWPLPAALLVSGLITVPLGVLIGLPSLRLRGVYFAVATLSFALAFDTVVPAIKVISGGTDGVSTPRPSLGALSFAGDRAMWYLVLAVNAVLALLVVNIRRGRTGRAFAAIRDNEVAAAASGLNVARYKLQGFALSAFIAGIGGALYAYTVGTPSPVDLDWGTSLQLVVVLVIVGATAVSGAATAGFLNYVALPLWVLPILDGFRIHLLPFFSHQGEQMIPLFFAILLIVQLNLVPEGLVVRMGRDLRTLAARLTGGQVAASAAGPGAPPTLQPELATDADLTGAVARPEPATPTTVPR